MRIFEPNFLTLDEIAQLLKIKQGTYKILSVKNPVVDRIVDRLLLDLDFKINEHSYWRIEQKPLGHDWHVDTGSNNHMPWCQIGVSILLTSNFTGGETYYTQDQDKTNAIKQERALGDLCAHTSDELHMVTAHEGKRIVFLMFI
jgi:hypothetical protein